MGDCKMDLHDYYHNAMCTLQGILIDTDSTKDSTGGMFAVQMPSLLPSQRSLHVMRASGPRCLCVCIPDGYTLTV
jgi:hypothetical protein